MKMLKLNIPKCLIPVLVCLVRKYIAISILIIHIPKIVTVIQLYIGLVLEQWLYVFM